MHPSGSVVARSSLPLREVGRATYPRLHLNASVCVRAAIGIHRRRASRCAVPRGRIRAVVRMIRSCSRSRRTSTAILTLASMWRSCRTPGCEGPGPVRKFAGVLVSALDVHPGAHYSLFPS
ncbi:hypothetical protein BD309DRAFT_971695 [Dichomitus squalens]|nr:hypothetical protein BD309DRAFT_971695 [Dichomitus squalens]